MCVAALFLTALDLLVVCDELCFCVCCLFLLALFSFCFLICWLFFVCVSVFSSWFVSVFRRVANIKFFPGGLPLHSFS